MESAGVAAKKNDTEEKKNHDKEAKKDSNLNITGNTPGSPKDSTQQDTDEKSETEEGDITNEVKAKKNKIEEEKEEDDETKEDVNKSRIVNDTKSGGQDNDTMEQNKDGKIGPEEKEAARAKAGTIL